MPDSKKKKPRNNTGAIIIIFIVMATVAGGAVYLGRGAFIGGYESPTVNVKMPLITTKLTQPSTGQEYNVQTLFTVKIDRDARRDVPNAMLEEALTAIMEEMDVDEIMGPEGPEYLNTRATELLNEHLADKGLENTRVIVTDLSTDDRIQLSNPASPVDDVAKGLFDKME